MKIHASPAGSECITLVYIACRAFERPREDAISMYVCVRTYVCMCTYVCTCTYVCMYIVCVRTYECIGYYMGPACLLQIHEVISCGITECSSGKDVWTHVITCLYPVAYL